MKKIIASILAFFSLGSAAETTEPTATAAAAAAVSEYTVISGEVLEINDSSLTLLLDMGEAPNGEAPDGQMPEKPDGDTSDSQPPEKPDSDTSNSQPPEKPDGDASNSQPPEMPDGQAPNGQMPGGRTVTVDTSNAIITRGGAEVTVKDISVGDKVSVSAKDGELSYTESDAAYGFAIHAGNNGGVARHILVVYRKPHALYLPLELIRRGLLRYRLCEACEALVSPARFSGGYTALSPIFRGFLAVLIRRKRILF
mgnify:CR=1 FL=1